MMDTFDQHVGQLAVSQGYVTQPQLERCHGARRAGDARKLSRIMLDLGFITAEQCIALEDQADASASAAPRAVLPIAPSASTSSGAWGADESAGDYASTDAFDFAEDADGFGGATIVQTPDSGLTNPLTARPVSGLSMPKPTSVRPIRPVSGGEASVRPVRPVSTPSVGPAAVRPVTPVTPKPVGPGAGPGVMRVKPVSRVTDSVPMSPIPLDASPEQASAMQELYDMAVAEVSLVGQTFAKCEIVAEIGEGGMGKVYKGRHAFLDKVVAVKVLAADLVEHAEFVERFMREAQSAAKLEHPNIVRTIDAGQENGRFYMVLDYVQGRTLAQLIEQRGKLPVADALYIVKEICRGLIAAHEAGVVHRDIKPENIMVDGPKVKILDFGLAKFTHAEQQVDLTIPGQILGSPHFIAPEQTTAGSIDARTDIYSLGAVFYRLVTGHYPFDSENPMAILMMHANDPLRPPKDLVPDIPPILDRLIVKMMAKQKDGRPRSARVLLGALEKLDFGPSELARSKPLPELTVSQLGNAVPAALMVTQVAKKPGTIAPVRPDSTASAAKIVRKPVSQGFVPVVPIDPTGDATAAGETAFPDDALDNGGLPMPVDDFAGLGTDFSAAETLLAPNVASAMPADPIGHILSSSAGQKSPATGPVADLIAQVKAALDDGDGVLAEQRIDEILRTAPENVEVYELQEQLMAMRNGLEPMVQDGIQLAQGNSLADAMAVFEKILKIDPQHRVATIQLKQLKSKYADADKFLADAKKKFKAGDYGGARKPIAEGLAIVPDHAELHALQGKLEQRAGVAEQFLGQAREHINNGDPDQALQVLGKLLEKLPTHSGAQALIAEIEEAAQHYREQFELGGDAFDRADFKAAFDHFNLALNANPHCEKSQRYLDECEPILAQYHALSKEAEAAAEAGDTHGALAIWQEILDTIAPGDTLIPDKIAEAHEAIKKLQRLEQTAENALKKRQYDAAIKSYQQILRIDAGHESASAGVALAERKKRGAQRRKRIRTVFLAMLIVAAAVSGGGYYLYTDDQTHYAEGIAKLEDARTDTNLATARLKYQAARDHFIAVRDSLVSAPLGLVPPDIADRIRDAETEIHLKEGQIAEAEEKWDEAIGHYSKLGETGADPIRRVKLLRVVKLHAAALAAAQGKIAALSEVGDFSGLATNSLDPTAVIASIDEATAAAHHLAELEAQFAQLEKPTSAAVPTLETLTEAEAAVLRPLPVERKAFGDFVEKYREMAARWNADERWIDLLLRLETQANIDPEGYFSRLEAELDALIVLPQESAWLDKYTAVLAPFRAYRAMVPIGRAQHGAFVHYLGAWQMLTQVNPTNRADSLDRAIAQFSTARQNFTDASAAARRQMRTPEVQQFARMRDLVDQIASWLDRMAQHIGTVPSMPARRFSPRMNVLPALATFKQLPSSNRLGIFGARDMSTLMLVRWDAVTQGEFDAFVRADYFDLKYWAEYLAKYASMPESFRRKRVEEHMPPPPTQVPNQAVVVSMFQIEAFMKWRADAIGDGARLADFAELEGMFGAGIPLTANLNEWVSNTPNPAETPQGVALATLAVRESATTLTAQPTDKGLRESVTFRLVYDFPIRPERPLELR